MQVSIHIDGIGKHGPWMGHFLQEPGCIWLASSPVTVMASAVQSIARFYAWLDSHGEPSVGRPAPDEMEPDAAEIQEVPNFGQTGAMVGFFASDAEPAQEGEIRTALRRLGYARRNLLESVSEVEPAALDLAPPNGKRTIRENLEHLRNMQGFLLTQLYGLESAMEILPDPWPDETFASLNWVMDRSAWALANLPESLREGVYTRGDSIEQWSARKVLRRFVEHEMEHLGVVRHTIQVLHGANRG